MTNDLRRVKKVNPKIVVYGHNHQVKEWFYEGIKFKANAVGYPGEYIGNNIKHFKILTYQSK
jgi:hypothetical protein